MTRFYGACGVPECTECLPLFDRDNAVIPGTNEPMSANALWHIAIDHDEEKFH